MGILTKLAEGIFKVRIVPKTSPSETTSFTDTKDSAANRITDAIDSGKRIDLSDLLNITSLKGDRNTKYEIFEEMVADGRIGAAVEMYANDTVQYNSEGKVIWIESEDSDIAEYGNKLIEDLNIPENIWSYAYCMWLYGDVYLELFENTSNNNTRPTLLLEPIKQNTSVRTQVPIQGAKLERYIEKVPNPAEVYDLQSKGKTSGFIRNKDNINSISPDNKSNYWYSGSTSNIDVLSPTKFVHICLSPNINRFPEYFRLIKDNNIEDKTEDGYIDGSETENSGDSLTFQVKTGQSILENVYGPYQTLKLKEESVLLERITKSSITRVIQVELGDMPESQKKKKLREIKNQIEQTLIMNKDAGTLQSRTGGQPIENILYTTTKNGKGTISTVNIGGDADIGNLDDLDQSENKVYGALLIPKALLGADMDGSGLSNGGSLTEMNTTYARRIKRGQLALCSAIKNLINIFALSEGLGAQVVNNFEVKLTPIITVEDNRRDELLQNKIRNVNDMLSLVDNMESITETTKLEMIIQWLGSYLNQQDIVDIINEAIKDIENNENENEDEESSSDNKDDDMSSGPSFGSSSSFDDFNNDSNIPNFDEEPIENETENNEEEDNNTPELSNQTNLSDIEGEDLL
jgi:hypothetical protein